MFYRDLLNTALHDIRANRSRTVLTVLGIVIGVAAVVLMTGVGRSMEGVILGQISALGPETIALWPGAKGPEGGGSTMNIDFDAITVRDVEAFEKLESVTNIAPMIFVPGKATYGREEMQPRVVGSTPEYYLNQHVETQRGRFHDSGDEDGARAVAVIGPDVADELFKDQDPIGARIGIGDRSFTVIGLLKPVGTQFFQNLDDRIIIPFSLARNILGRDYVDMVTFRATGEAQRGVEDIEYLLRKRHDISNPPDDPTKDDDFLVRTAQQAADILGTVSLALTLFITLIASVSLVVGGIGIMNIMLVSVTERTQEIGLRKALGARSRDILLLFLVEACVVTILGALAGFVLGIFIDFLIVLIVQNFLASYNFALNPIAMVATMFMALFAGLGFGIYPARKAAQLSPIEALRYE